MFIKSFKEIRLTLSTKYNHKIIPISNTNFISKDQEIKEIENLPISILQLEGPLFFGSTESLVNIYMKDPNHEILIIDMSSVTMIDLSGAYALEDLINNLKLKNIKVILFNKNTRIESFLDKINFINNIGIDYYKNSKESVLSAILKFR